MKKRKKVCKKCKKTIRGEYVIIEKIGKVCMSCD